MNIKEIHCFVRCFECGSINKAAKELFITPQGLSRVIHNLETEFHTDLFIRSSQGIQPTEAGNLLYKHSKELLAKMETIEVEMRRIKDRDKTIKIGYAYGVLHILPLYEIEKYRKQKKDVNMQWEEISNAEIIESISKGELDIGYIIGKVIDKKLEIKELYQTKLCAFVYEGHPYYEKEKIKISDLEGESLITLNEKYHCYSALVQRCKDYGFVPNIAMKTFESIMIYEFCEQKMGIGIDVNIHRIKEMHPSLHCIEIEDISPWSIQMICKKSKARQKNIKDIMVFSENICCNK